MSMQRRTLLRRLGTTSAAIGGSTATLGTASAADDIGTVYGSIHYDTNVPYIAVDDYANTVENKLDSNCTHSFSISPGYEISQSEVKTAGENDSSVGSDDENDPLACFDAYVRSNLNGYTEGSFDVWTFDAGIWESTYNHDGWVPGAAMAAGGIRTEGDALAPVAATNGVDYGAGTILHEVTHLLMSPDHEHHNIYDWREHSSDDVDTTVMAGDPMADTSDVPNCCPTSTRLSYFPSESELGVLTPKVVDEYLSTGDAYYGSDTTDCHYGPNDPTYACYLEGSTVDCY